MTFNACKIVTILVIVYKLVQGSEFYTVDMGRIPNDNSSDRGYRNIASTSTSGGVIIDYLETGHYRKVSLRVESLLNDFKCHIILQYNQ